MLYAEIEKHFPFNATVNILDAAFFGLGLGLASYVTIIPLFVADLTDSTVLIGLIAALQAIGWQLPQVFFANIVSRLKRYKPMVILFTSTERFPYFGLVLLALFVPRLDNNLILILLFILIIIQTFGGGITANAWLSMVSKVIPSRRLGTFFGIHGAASHLMTGIGAVAAGYILGNWVFPGNFALCFLITGISMTVSWGFLAATREPQHELTQTDSAQSNLWQNLIRVMRTDGNFRWFLLVRGLTQLATMAIAFYTVYALRRFDMSPQTAGFMTGLLAFTQTASSVVMGWAGDRWGHVRMLSLANIAMALSAAIAMLANDLIWFYLVFALAGVVLNAQWSTLILITFNFSGIEERPFYIGLSSSLTAPIVLISPLLGGFLADTVGFGVTFAICIVAALAAILIAEVVMEDPAQKRKRKGKVS